MTHARVRVGILLDRPVVPRWLVAVFEYLRSCPYVDIVAVVFCYSDSPKEVPAIAPLYKWYSRLDSRRTYIRKNVASITSVLGEIPQLTVVPGGDSDSEGILRKDLDRLARLNCDLFLNCGWGNTADTLRNASRFGVWNFLHGGIPSDNYMSTGFWEVYFKQPTSHASLAALAPNGLQYNLGKSSIRTHPTSPHINGIRLQRSSIALLDYRLRQLSENAFDAVDFFRLFSELKLETLAPLRSTPSNWEMMRFAISNAIAIARGRFEGRYRLDQWTIGVTNDPIGESPETVFRNVRWLPTEPDRFFADPFVVSKNGKRYLFAEEFPYQTRQGRISVAEIEQDGAIQSFTPVLERPFHLSFPFVFFHEGRHYMVPEQATTNQVVLYEAVSFPHTWQEKKVLLDNFPGVDNVLLRHNNRWWLFTTFGKLYNQDNNLQLFFADDLFGEFKPHPMNPVKLDIASSRMAGNIFIRDSKLIRPAQNGSIRYGGSVVLNEITTLSETAYEERKIGEIKPDQKSPFNAGLHTINMEAGITVCTGLRYILDPRGPTARYDLIGEFAPSPIAS